MILMEKRSIAMRKTQVLFVAFMSAVMALPAYGGMASARGSDREAPAQPTRPVEQTADRSEGNLIIVTDDGVPVTQDGRVLLLREANDRDRPMQSNATTDRQPANPAFSAEDYRQAVDAARAKVRLHGHDDRTSGSVSISTGTDHVDRSGREVNRSGLIYTRRVVREGINGSAMIYEYRVTPSGTKFIYYRDNGNGYAYLRKVDTRDDRHDRYDHRRGHGHHDRDFRPILRGRDGDDGRAGRLIISSED
jgi:hypothetical protein